MTLATLLRDYQQQAVEECAPRPGSLLDMVMGGGKSLTAYGLLERWQVQRALVVCPLSVCRVWPRENAERAGLPWRVVALDEGSVKDKRERAEHELSLGFHKGEPVVLAINYESAWREPFASLAKRMAWDAVIADEVHRCKSPGGKQSRFMGRLTPVSRHRLGLSGTPLPHSILDAYAQYRFLDPRIFGTSYNRFKRRYAEMGGYGSYQVVGWKNLDEFERRFKSIAFQLHSKEALDLPPEVDVVRTCQLEPAAQRVYQSVERHFWAEVEGGQITVANALVKLLKLQQITSGDISVESYAVRSEHPPDLQEVPDSSVRHEKQDGALHELPQPRESGEQASSPSAEEVSDMQEKQDQRGQSKSEKWRPGSPMSSVLSGGRSQEEKALPEMRQAALSNATDRSENPDGAMSPMLLGEPDPEADLPDNGRIRDAQTRGAVSSRTQSSLPRTSRTEAEVIRKRSSQERSTERQSDREPRAMGQAAAARPARAGSRSVGGSGIPGSGERRDGLVSISTAKTELLGEILFDVAPPVVVFCRFHADLDRVHAAAAARGWKSGEISGRSKDALDSEGRLAEGIELAAVQIQAGGVGVDLSRASVAIYYSLGFSLAEYAQSRDRLHRPGQTGDHVAFIHLVCESTVDRVVLGALAKRKQVIEAILGGEKP